VDLLNNFIAGLSVAKKGKEIRKNMRDGSSVRKGSYRRRNQRGMKGSCSERTSTGLDGQANRALAEADHNNILS